MALLADMLDASQPGDLEVLLMSPHISFSNRRLGLVMVKHSRTCGAADRLLYGKIAARSISP